MKNDNKLVLKLAYLLRLKNLNMISSEEYERIKAYIYTKYHN